MTHHLHMCVHLYTIIFFTWIIWKIIFSHIKSYFFGSILFAYHAIIFTRAKMVKIQLLSAMHARRMFCNWFSGKEKQKVCRTTFSSHTLQSVPRHIYETCILRTWIEKLIFFFFLIKLYFWLLVHINFFFEKKNEKQINFSWINEKVFSMEEKSEDFRFRCTTKM